MTLSVPIHPATEARLRQLEQEEGKDVASFVSELVEEVAARGEDARVQSPADFDSALDELFASDTRKLPAVPLTYSRDDIYTDHD